MDQTPPKVFLRHPHTGDVQEVDGTPAAMVPLMIHGYQQFQPAPAAPAQGE
jgi:hypothetical protein